jgi:hypothetical protein
MLASIGENVSEHTADLAKDDLAWMGALDICELLHQIAAVALFLQVQAQRLVPPADASASLALKFERRFELMMKRLEGFKGHVEWLQRAQLKFVVVEVWGISVWGAFVRDAFFHLLHAALVALVKLRPPPSLRLLLHGGLRVAPRAAASRAAAVSFVVCGRRGLQAGPAMRAYQCVSHCCQKPP